MCQLSLVELHDIADLGAKLHEVDDHLQANAASLKLGKVDVVDQDGALIGTFTDLDADAYDNVGFDMTNQGSKR